MVCFLVSLVYLKPRVRSTNEISMKKIGLVIISILTLTFVKAQEMNCFERLESGFKERGAYTVSDDIHRNVIVVFFEDDDTFCVKGKARVENGTISSIFIYYDDNTSELFDKKFYNQKKQAPTISNGISEMIITSDNEKLKVVFVDKIKPRKKQFKKAIIPDDF